MGETVVLRYNVNGTEQKTYMLRGHSSILIRIASRHGTQLKTPQFLRITDDKPKTSTATLISNDDGTLFRLCIVRWDKSSTTIDIPSDLATSVQTLRETLANALKTDTDRLSLRFGATRLEDGGTLDDYGISEGATVVIDQV